MFSKSLQWRLVSFFCLMAFCLIIPIGLYLNKKVEDSYYKNFRRDVDNGFKGWSIDKFDEPTVEVIFSDLRDNNFAGLFSIIGENKSYTIVDRRDINEIASSDPNFDEEDKGAFLNQLLASDNFIRALNGEIGNERKLISIGDSEFLDYARPEGDFVLYFRCYKDEWQGVIDSFNRSLVTSIVIAFTVAFVLGYILSKTVTMPIVRIMHKAQAIAAGDFDQTLEVKSNDEIGQLTKTFNYMATSLKETLDGISSEKNKVETILNYMTDGVIAFDLKGKIIHANPAAEKILGKIDSSMDFASFTRDYNIDIDLQEVLYLEVLSSKEANIKVGERDISVYFAVFTDKSSKPQGIIAVLHDITEQQKLENMRKEFVANVSHELRTPLTSIKSYTETLLDGMLEDVEVAQKFLGVINSEADRMTRLVRDLLQLSKLDNNQMQWRMEPVMIDKLVKSSVEKMQIEAKNKNQQLECFVMGNIPETRADYDRMEQVMLNLLSNAIKYTPENGKITVYVSSIYDAINIKIVDTGIGIPEEDLPRIFERFYRVDKARSREMGGTGLGLSIAKEIVEAHSGTLTIKSEYGKGTEVTIKLPVIYS